MKGLKFLAACAAVGAVSVACAVSSLAADPTYQLTVSEYNATNGTIDITVPDEYTALVGGDYTLLVLTEAGNAAASITNENSGEVVQIQQGDSTILTGVKVGTITPTEADQTFYVRVGGANATTENPTGFAAGTFTVKGTGSDSPYTDPDRLLGDVDGSGDLTLDDAVVIISYDVDGDTDAIADIDTASAADVDESGDLTLDDAVIIISYDVDGDDSTLDGSKTISQRSEPCENY